jgi:hypothetical protein
MVAVRAVVLPAAAMAASAVAAVLAAAPRRTSPFSSPIVESDK